MPQIPFLYGAGGGFSEVFSRPWYQTGVVVPTPTGRAVPDIGLDADPTTGMLIGETQTFALDSRYGPAGVHYGEFRHRRHEPRLAADGGLRRRRQQAMGGRRIGFANPYIYSLARPRGAYYDVTPQGDAGNVARRLHQRLQRDRRVSLHGPHVQPGLVTHDGSRLGRCLGSRQPEPEQLRPGQRH